jgi:hypothetical protein
MTSSAADDIVFDILNGHMLNECARTPHNRHFTRYLEAGNVFVHFRDNKPFELVDDKSGADVKMVC